MDWSSKRVWIGTAGVAAVVVAAISVAAFTLPNLVSAPGVSAAPSRTALPPAPSATPSPEVSLFADYPRPEPTVHYEGPTTCESLVPAGLLADVRARGFELSDGLHQKALEEPNGLYAFLELRGLVCSISDEYWNLVRYAYGPIDHERAEAEAALLAPQELTAKPYGLCTLYSYDDAGDGPRGFESPPMYAFCDGFWVMSAGEDAGVLDQMIAAGMAEFGS